MGLRRPAAVLLLLSALIAACVTPAAREEAERTFGSAPSAPTFPPLPSPVADDPSPPGPDDDATASDADAEPDEAAEPAPEPPPEETTPTEEPPPPVSVVITDPRGDVQHPPLRNPPAYVDLLEVRMTATADVLEMLITVADDVPHRQDRDDRTMNVALFLDITGDGAIDHEVWANLAGDGWFPAHRDNRERVATFGTDTGITVEPSGATLRFDIPQGLIDRPTSFRWVTATEWGDYTSLGTDLAARDRAPQDGPASFP